MMINGDVMMMSHLRNKMINTVDQFLVFRLMSTWWIIFSALASLF